MKLPNGEVGDTFEIATVVELAYRSLHFCTDPVRVTWGRFLVLIRGLVLVSAIPVVVFADVAPFNSAADVVKGFQSDLIAVMKLAQKLDYQGRYERLAPAVKKSHDLAGIARIVVGRHWSKLTNEQKEKFIETFSQLSIATYANKFASYTSEEFRFVSAQETANGDRYVRTLLLDSKGEEIRFDYLLRRHDDRWTIVNIIVDGVSDLALKRSEYSGIVRREGYDALIAKLEEKIVRYAGSEK